jgi:hypothetical protein
VAGHATGHRVNGVAHLHAVLLQDVGHLAQRMLGLRDRHAVTRHDDHRLGILHQEGCVLRRTRLDRLV